MEKLKRPSIGARGFQLSVEEKPEFLFTKVGLR